MVYRTVVGILYSVLCITTTTLGTQQPIKKVVEQSAAAYSGHTVGNIIIHGNKLIATDTLLAKIPYRIGEPFKPQKARQLIKTLYRLGSVSSVKVSIQELNAQEVVVIVAITEKQPVSEFSFVGNNNLRQEEIEKKIKVSEITALDEPELIHIADRLKRLYAEKNYHHVTIESSLQPASDGKMRAQFEITEGCQTHVQRVFIQGNRCYSSKLIKSLLFTREDWVLSFLNKAGTYQKDALDYDKSVIENFYHNNGYLAARVKDISIEPIPDSTDVNVTFHIEEDDIYTIESVKAPGNTLLSEEEILAAIAIKPGQLYSQEAIRNTIEALRMLWGEFGYIYADVEPSVIPNEKTKTVAIEFHTNLGNCMRLNRIVLIGNKKTRDKVIRRQLLLTEGELLTTRKLELSKERVQSLGYFDARNGVNWKIIKLDEEHADLELMLQEIKTGQFYAQMGTGGMLADKYSPSETFRVSIGAQDINFLGLGIQTNFNASYSRQERSLDFSVANPWLWDRPLYGSLNFFNRKSTYEEYRGVERTPTASGIGGFGQLGFAISGLASANALAELGLEKIQFNRVVSLIPALQPLTDRLFASGNLMRVGFNVIQDLRSHPVMPNRGYIWNMSTKWAVPHTKGCFGFVKWELDWQWYTPLINEYDLILRTHAFFGFIKRFDNHVVPYRDLFHIGGPATVRGFLFGQIGPNFVDPETGINNSLGGTKTFVINVELLFPIRPDNSIRGVVFYDGGAGWDTPYPNLVPFGLRNNQFSYRHAIGLGVRLTRPTPVRFDIGFKLDRRKRLGETLSEVHFTMAQDF